jgi:MarR family 2-MHQ and catechol resistance regulon transcriptional repressor
MMKAMRALTRYAAAGIEETGLGLSDFGVLEVLLHKGPLPVNTIGPIVDLTPGSIRDSRSHPRVLASMTVWPTR